ncbi:MAG: translocation/assembly module TamB [Muribaculaceae bacterium]|nr:translocation/assembly module TamB [Muribaculaceae bacterium]
MGTGVKVARHVYRVTRSVLFTAVIAVGLLYFLLYILLSVPPVQNYIKERAEKELTAFLKGDVRIGSVDIFPFNEVRLKDVEFYTPEKERCISIGTLGAGIRLWRLIKERRIEITYAEILDLDGKVWQKEEGGPLNIAYIIDALAPKEKNKPPTKFDLQIHNIVIRRSALSFDRKWLPDKPNRGGEENVFDPNHISLTELQADLTLPRLKNDDFTIDLRRLAFKAGGCFDVKRLALKTHITDRSLAVKDFRLIVGEGEITLADLSFDYPSLKEIASALESSTHKIELAARNVSPKEYRFFYPGLKDLSDRYDISLNAAGNMDIVDIERFELKEKGNDFSLDMQADVENLRNKENLLITLDYLKVSFPEETIKKIGRLFIKGNTLSILDRTGEVGVDLSGKYSFHDGGMAAMGEIHSSLGDLSLDVEGEIKGKNRIAGRFDVSSSGFNLGKLLNKDKFGETSFSINGNIAVKEKEINGGVYAEVDYFDFNNHRFTDISVEGEKSGEVINADLNIADALADLTINGTGRLAGTASQFNVDGNINSLYPNIFGLPSKFNGMQVKGNILADIQGNNIDNITGNVEIDNLLISRPSNKEIRLDHIGLTAWKREQLDTDTIGNESPRGFRLDTGFMTAILDGDFKIGDLSSGVMGILADNVTSFVTVPRKSASKDAYANLKVKIYADKRFPEYLKLPVRPLTDIDLNGKIDLREGIVECQLTAPYLLQGTQKLISHSRLYGIAERGKGASASITTTIPVKNDRMNLEAKIDVLNDAAHIGLGWDMNNNKTATGNIGLDCVLSRNAVNGHTDINVNINPSLFSLGPSEWKIDEAQVQYTDKRLNIDGLRIWHDNQFVTIDGLASVNPEDELNIALSEIDLEYIFGILNINYVSFGGVATGEIMASSVFTKNPIARTRSLKVQNLSYNDAVLGDADIQSLWNNKEKEVEIHADISETGFGGARIDGGIFVARDSLSFDMEARKINIEFLKPFMAAFTSDVGGRASGKVKLFGTFKDIDLTGHAFADSIYMKVDYTNVYYHGSDSVLLNPGRIEIPSFRLYDRYGNSAMFSGFVKHRYFHDPEFEFKLTDARNLLCYDTNASLNPDWYGTIYASGKGSLFGRPGIVAMEMDMTTDSNSDFTFVLSETQTALDYSFLTFSDRRKEEEESKVVVEETFEEKFKKMQTDELSVPTMFAMDLRATVTPQAKMTLIMDPNAGDKITARGAGPLQIHYDTESDEMTMYGKYTLVEGNYNFSLQELILRDFKIREGSNISFNGDPLSAAIDIVAAYRVNTNLSDLDKSFSTDRDLNRTNVPVDALLKVRGDLQNPDISFDLSLPTLTSDVERKVRSIISTEDQMSRQIIYLLALNRFYTPEYMGSSSNGGELASVASSTISSQLTNIMGQLTDKFTLAPSFRSDKGDFSDMEVDVSLSSRLLNNRLLINGNFGYRDRSTSQTTFVGDFDIEYLLSRNGNLRLKAYNHFNDQNYYLKSSLTTQGIGVVYRKEFDNPLTWLRRKKKTAEEEPEEEDAEEGEETEKIEENE